MTDKVYVVIAESGEYSDRNDWIAGVFTDKAEAERLVLEKSEEKCAKDVLVDAWYEKYRKLTKALPAGADWSVRYRSAREAAGPCPESIGWDRLYLAEVPLDVWGEFEF